MPNRRMPKIALPAVLLSGLLVACGPPAEQAKSMPDAGALVSESAKRLKELRSVNFSFSVNGTIPGFAVRAANARAKASGWAMGTVDVQHDLEHTEYEFTLREGTVYLTDGEGERTRRPVPEEYTPERLFSPESGLRRLLLDAAALRTETDETLRGTPTFRVTGKIGKRALAKFVPGVWDDAIIKFWLAKSRGHTLRRIWVQLPPRRPNAGVVAIELALSEHNSISQPSGSRQPGSSSPT